MRKESFGLLRLMTGVTGFGPKIRGTSVPRIRKAPLKVIMRQADMDNMAQFLREISNPERLPLEGSGYTWR